MKSEYYNCDLNVLYTKLIHNATIFKYDAVKGISGLLDKFKYLIVINVDNATLKKDLFSLELNHSLHLFNCSIVSNL